MKYCKKCGSELKGAKNFCMVCGAKQDEKKKEEKPDIYKKEKTQDKESETGTCVRCGDETEKKCFFCKDFVCRDHYNRMQANKLSFPEINAYKSQQETKRVNEGWRGFIINACSKCTGKKSGKYLTDEETVAISTIDHCSWYKLDF